MPWEVSVKLLLGIPILVAGNYGLVILERRLDGWHGIGVAVLLGLWWNSVWLRYMIRSMRRS